LDVAIGERGAAVKYYKLSAQIHATHNKCIVYKGYWEKRKSG
jgi:hypothetical protein